MQKVFISFRGILHLQNGIFFFPFFLESASGLKQNALNMKFLWRNEEKVSLKPVHLLKARKFQPKKKK
jgi:hypothetical protein